MIFAGVVIRISEFATALPSGKPQTDDMRDMVEHFHRLGLIQRVPAAYMINNHTAVVHPTLAKRLECRGGT
jgi:hypothetical protein